MANAYIIAHITGAVTVYPKLPDYLALAIEFGKRCARLRVRPEKIGVVMMIPHQLISAGARFSELHPYTWAVAWKTAHLLRFLLPHDKSYYALRHFINALPNGLFLDIGANDGISVLSFRRFDRSYHILSLEPNGMMEPALRKLKASDPHFEYKIVGAGSASAVTRFFVPVYRGVALHTFTSARPGQAREGVRSVFGETIAASTKLHPIEGEVIKVDDLNVDPTIAKIDAEGFDYDVLLGMDATLARARPFVMIEVCWDNKDKIVQFLKARNYSVLTYDHAQDEFSINIAGKHRNYFAVPKERISTLTVKAC
jgi:FkbM family methyltransferase